MAGPVILTLEFIATERAAEWSISTIFSRRSSLSDLSNPILMALHFVGILCC